VYVYFVYGMHHCLNLAVDSPGVPGCVLIRAAEPMDAGLPPRALSGPGRLCRVLAIDTSLSGTHLFAPRSGLTLRPGPPPRLVGVSTRVGIRHAADRPLRFFDADSDAVSRGPRALRTR
jgi:DNA-3-methyladenine glycosylase